MKILNLKKNFNLKTSLDFFDFYVSFRIAFQFRIFYSIKKKKNWANVMAPTELHIVNQ